MAAAIPPILQMPITCSVYGLGVQVNVPIAGLAGLAPSSHVDVNITLGTMPPDIGAVPESDWLTYYISPDQNESGAPSVTASKLPGDTYFRIAYADGTAVFVNADGSGVWATWPDPATVEDTATYLLGPALGFVLRRRGVTCLHASAVVIDGQAIALVGPSGAGKSSTAAAFARLGYPVLSDDVVALADQGSRFKVQPAYPRVRLWPESVESLFGDSDALERITPSWEKRFLNLNGTEYQFQREPLPLGAIYFLSSRGGLGEPSLIEPLGLGAGLMSLVSDTSTTFLLDRQNRAKEFELLGRLVQCVPLRRVTPSSDISRISDLCHAIVDDFRQLTWLQPTSRMGTE